MGISILAWLSSRDGVESQYESRDDNQANIITYLVQIKAFLYDQYDRK
jgi:hypothetical protein